MNSVRADLGRQLYLLSNYSFGLKTSTRIKNKIMEDLMKVGKISSERYGFFNFTASYSGVYRIRFYYYSSEKPYPT